MVDEVEIVRRAVGTPSPDPEARERARARLRDVMAFEHQVSAHGRRRPLWRPVRWLGAAAAIVTIVLIAQTLLPPHGGGPVTSAATELRQLASVASSSKAVEIPDGSFFFVSREESGLDSRESLTSGRSYNYVVERTVKTWTAADGSEIRATTTHSVTFPTVQDRGQWDAEGQPSLFSPETEVVFFGNGQLVHYDLSDLPTDPHELGTWIRAGKVIVRGSDDLDVLAIVETLLASTPASPELRASLFQVAADLPGIELLGSVQDPRGRTGIGVQIVDGANAHVLIFNSSTSEVLALLTVPTAGGAPISSEVYGSSRIVDQAPPIKD